MGLINSLQHTNLKDFPKYTGYQPLIRKDIKDPPIYNSVSKQIQSRGDDVLRLTKLMTTGPGVKWLGNTASLLAIDKGRDYQKPPQEERPDIGEAKTFFGGVLNFLANVFNSAVNLGLDTAAVAAETIAQSGVAGSGVHLVLGFKGKQGYLARTQGHVFSSRGTEIPIPNSFSIGGGSSELENAVSKTYAQSNLKYPNKFDAKTYSYNPNENYDTSSQSAGEEFVAGLGFTNVEDLFASAGSPPGGATPQNVRKLKDFTDATHSEIASNVQKEKRLGLPHTGGRGLARYTKGIYANPVPETQDQITVMNPTDQENESLKDFIKFHFEIIDPDPGEKNTFLYFRAYLDSLSDAFTGTWNSHKYFGRAEDFYTYGGFQRALSFGFKAFANTREELKPLYKKLAILASTTAPTYDTDQSFMRGTIVNVTIGDYVVSQPGFFGGVNYSWSQGYPWEINLGETESIQQLPHLLDCSLEFTPIHRFAPQTGGYHYITNPKDNKYFHGGTKYATDDFAPFSDSMKLWSDEKIADLQKNGLGLGDINSAITSQMGSSTTGFNYGTKSVFGKKSPSLGVTAGMPPMPANLSNFLKGG